MRVRKTNVVPTRTTILPKTSAKEIRNLPIALRSDGQSDHDAGALNLLIMIIGTPHKSWGARRRCPCPQGIRGHPSRIGATCLPFSLGLRLSWKLRNKGGRYDIQGMIAQRNLCRFHKILVQQQSEI